MTLQIKIVFPWSEQPEIGGTGRAPRPALPRPPGASGPGAPERLGHRADRGVFFFLSCDLSAGPGRQARGAKRGAPRRGRAKPPAAGPGPGVSAPARADLVGSRCSQTHN